MADERPADSSPPPSEALTQQDPPVNPVTPPATTTGILPQHWLEVAQVGDPDAM